MNFLKQTMKVFILALLLSATSCQDKYPDLEDGLYAEFVTNKGTMVAKLYFEQAPVTVANFVALAEGTHPNVADSLKGKRYYNGIIFHRVIDKFMIQGGDPTGTGSGDPGYKFTDEFNPDLRHNKPGILSMANSGANTNGSQFFITEGPTPNLDAFDAQGNLKKCDNPRVSCHAVFGEVVLGLDVQDSISNVKIEKPSNKPFIDVVINELNIVRKGKAAKAFDAPKVYTEELPKIAENTKRLKEEAEEKLKEQAKQATENFLKKNEALKGKIKTLPGVKPTSTDKVLVNYAGFFEDGKLFDTSWVQVAKDNDQYNEQRDKANGYKPFAMIYNETAQLVPGFREAMLNMNVGDKAHVFIPSYLGYGENGMGPIPGNTNLVFDLEIMGIEK